MLDKKDFPGNTAMMRKVAELLTMWADDLEKYGMEDGGKDTADEAAAEAPVISEAVSLASEGPPAPPYTLEAVLAYLGTKIARGFKPQVQALINSYGARKVSEVDPAYYGDLIEAVALLGGDGHA